MAPISLAPTPVQTGVNRGVLHKARFLVASAPSAALIWGMAPNAQHPFLRRSVAAVSIGLVLATGCSGDDDSNGSTTTTRSTSTTSPTTGSTQESTSTTVAADSEAELRAAVRAFWDLYLELGASTAPFDEDFTRERLAERTTGRELNQLLATFSNNAATGVAVRGEIDVAPTVVSIEGTTAQVRDCYDDTTGLYRISDGTRVDADDPARHQVLMTFELEDGIWKVSAIADEGTGCSV